MNVYCEQGWIDLLDEYVASGKPSRIRLFANNHTPLPTDTEADYVEATFSGYPGYTPLVWGSAFINPSNQGQVNASQVLWQHNGGGISELVYGVYITDDDDVLQYAERFAAAVLMDGSTDSIEYQPRLTLINQ